MATPSELALPPIFTKPPSASIFEVLHALRSPLASFDAPSDNTKAPEATVWITSIVSSPLTWVSEQEREDLWELAALRLSERAGRVGRGDITRTFRVTDRIEVVIHEPALTNDTLGWKTWGAALCLSRHITTIMPKSVYSSARVLELGAGTGLVGISTAAIGGFDVTLTDLDDVLSNLQFNIHQNIDLIHTACGRAVAIALDWRTRASGQETLQPTYDVILGADLLYASEHPILVANMVEIYLCKRSAHARFFLELPMRQGYQKEIQQLETELQDRGLCLAQPLVEELGYDDWGESVAFKLYVWKWGGQDCVR